MKSLCRLTVTIFVFFASCKHAQDVSKEKSNEYRSIPDEIKAYKTIEKLMNQGRGGSRTLLGTADPTNLKKCKLLFEKGSSENGNYADMTLSIEDSDSIQRNFFVRAFESPTEDQPTNDGFIKKYDDSKTNEFTFQSVFNTLDILKVTTNDKGNISSVSGSVVSLKSRSKPLICKFE